MNLVALKTLLLSIVISVAIVDADQIKIVDSRTILNRILMPQELLFPFFPKHYCATVTFNGSCGKEIDSAVKNIGLSSPQFKESFDGNGFYLYIANPEYPVYTRDLLSGILNPVEMIDMVIGSILNYRKGDAFEKLLIETICTEQPVTSGPKQFHLTAKNDRFGYNQQDNGSYLHENWFSAMNLHLDTVLGILYQIDVTRCSRTTDITQSLPSSTDTTKTRYIISYDTFDSHPIPSRLDIIADKKDTLISIRATYEKKGKQLEFKRKEIFAKGKTPSSLIIDYISYTYRQCSADFRKKGLNKKHYSRHLSAASELGRKATSRLRDGNISGARSVLEVLVSKYDGTPQALEARNLLVHLKLNNREH